MPLYEYRCRSCSATVEVIQKFSDPELSDCAACGGSLEKVLAAPAIRFKGAGWYVNDYAGRNSNGTAPKSETGGSNGSSETGTPKESSVKDTAKEKVS